MSWHYLRGQAAESWGGCYADGVPGALLKLMPTAVRSYYSGSATGTCLGFQSGTTCGHSTVGRGEARLMLSQVVFPVKTSALRVPVGACPASVLGWYSRCSELLQKFNLRLSSPKTYRLCVKMDSVRLSRDLLAWGMWDASDYWGLSTSAHHIKGVDYGLWLPTLRASKRSIGDSRAKTVGEDIIKGHTVGGKLIALREWLMGWPIGWSNAEPLAMDRFQLWQRLHGVC